jgi:hypothetical protein
MAKRQPRRTSKAPTVVEDTTPIRKALQGISTLQPHVRDGIGAVKSVDRDYLSQDVRQQLADSMDLDAAMATANPQDHRWDTLLGHTTTSNVVAVEPHSARSDQVSTIIAKKVAALTQLRPHLRPGVKVAAWIWVASGSVSFSPFDAAIRKLNEKGITFAGRQVLPKHFPP